jgi:hypothetical protein
MGWWSADIFGGDTPLDEVYELEQMIGVEDIYPIERWDDDVLEAVTQGLFKCRDSLAHKMEKGLAEGSSYGAVFAQIVGAIWMATGLPMPDEIRAATLRGCDDDEWMREEGTLSERGRIITAFRETVEQYDGIQRVITKTKGLFERFDELMTSPGEG